MAKRIKLKDLLDHGFLKHNEEVYPVGDPKIVKMYAVVGTPLTRSCLIGPRDSLSESFFVLLSFIFYPRG